MKRLWTILLLAALPPAGADAGTSSRHLAYDIYTGGFKTLSAALSIENGGDAYNMAMRGRTEGLISIFTKWEGTMETGGRAAPGDPYPLRHESVSVWPDNRQVKKMAWGEGGGLQDLYVLDEGETSGLADVPPGIGKDRVDIMTAALSIMQQAAKNGSCAVKSEVFDGKRSFVLRGIDRGREDLSPSRYNIYHGPALKCEIGITPLEGDWHEKLRGWMSIQQQGRRAGAAPTVWLAQLEDGGPAVPVKIRARTAYGMFMMHLKGYR